MHIVQPENKAKTWEELGTWYDVDTLQRFLEKLQRNLEPGGTWVL